MSLLLAAGIIGGLGAITKTAIGGYNLWRGQMDYNSLMRNAPKYNPLMPELYSTAVNVAARGYYEGQDTTDYERALAGVSSSQINQMGRYATSSQQMIGAVEQAYARQLESLNKLSLDQIQRRDVARQMYIQSMLSKAEAERSEKEKEFEYNQWLPWQMKLNTADSRAQSGREMLYGGISDVFSTASSLAMAQYQTNLLRELFQQPAQISQQTGQVYQQAQPSNYSLPAWGQRYIENNMNYLNANSKPFTWGRLWRQ